MQKQLGHAARKRRVELLRAAVETNALLIFRSNQGLFSKDQAEATHPAFG